MLCTTMSIWDGCQFNFYSDRESIMTITDLLIICLGFIVFSAANSIEKLFAAIKALS